MPPIPFRTGPQPPPTLTAPPPAGGGMGARLVQTLRWRPGTPTIQRFNDRGERDDTTVGAQVYGPLCVHRSTDTARWRQQRAAYHVTVVGLGLLVAWTDAEADARALAEALVREAGEALRQSTKDDCVDAIPEWVKEWCREVRARKTFIDPSEFKE